MFDLVFTTFSNLFPIEIGPTRDGVEYAYARAWRRGKRGDRPMEYLVDEIVSVTSVRGSRKSRQEVRREYAMAIDAWSSGKSPRQFRKLWRAHQSDAM